MSDHTIRLLEPAEYRAAFDLFLGALHLKPVTDKVAERIPRLFQPERSFGAFDSELIGTADSFDEQLTVPGGRRVPMAAVTAVGVRADRTRRGVLTGLMRAQLNDFAGRGVVAAGLYASEATIYGRFGYGISTRSKSYKITKRGARLRPEIPVGGEVALLPVDTALTTLTTLPGIYDELTHTRPGMLTRSSFWWAGFESRSARSAGPMRTVVHHGPAGPDGFACYQVSGFPAGASVLTIDTLMAADPVAFAGLWRYLLSVDLVDEIHAYARALDEPVELLFTDARQCEVTKVEDEMWLRLVDVEAALSARVYGAGSLVLEIADPMLPANSGRYRVGADGVSRTDEQPGLRMGVDVLAMMYHGTWQASALAAVGRVEVLRPEAPATADELFSTRGAAWCGTFF